jgi:hypothetical protein
MNPNTCSYCGGNDADTPCAFPSENRPGCLQTPERVQERIDWARSLCQVKPGKDSEGENR